MTATKGPSEHLSWKELGCRDGTPYPVVWRDTRAVVLAREFERIRIQVGRPIVIGSAYRTPTYNKQIGGAANSQHCLGRALDLYPPTGMTANELYEIVKQIARDDASDIFGVGKYPTFIHFDVRPPRADGRVTYWHGTRAWAEVKDL